MFKITKKETIANMMCGDFAMGPMISYEVKGPTGMISSGFSIDPIHGDDCDAMAIQYAENDQRSRKAAKWRARNGFDF